MCVQHACAIVDGCALETWQFTQIYGIACSSGNSKHLCRWCCGWASKPCVVLHAMLQGARLGCTVVSCVCECAGWLGCVLYVDQPYTHGLDSHRLGVMQIVLCVMCLKLHSAVCELHQQPDAELCGPQILLAFSTSPPILLHLDPCSFVAFLQADCVVGCQGRLLLTVDAVGLCRAYPCWATDCCAYLLGFVWQPSADPLLTACVPFCLAC